MCTGLVAMKVFLKSSGAWRSTCTQHFDIIEFYLFDVLILLLQHNVCQILSMGNETKATGQIKRHKNQADTKYQAQNFGDQEVVLLPRRLDVRPR